MKRLKLILALLGATLMLNAQYRPLDKDSVRTWKKNAYKYSLTVGEYFLSQQNASNTYKIIDTIINTSGSGYGVGDNVGVNMFFGGFAPYLGSTGKIVHLSCFNDSLGSAGLNVHLFNGVITGSFIDNSASVLDKGQLNRWLNTVSMSANVLGTGQGFVAPGGTGAALREYMNFKTSKDLSVLITAAGSGTYNRGRLRLLMIVQFM